MLSAASSMISLPPMGIRNPSGLALDTSLHLLITPHGDQELVGRAWGVRGRRAHYPPWGSGT